MQMAGVPIILRPASEHLLQTSSPTGHEEGSAMLYAWGRAGHGLRIRFLAGSMKSQMLYGFSVSVGLCPSAPVVCFGYLWSFACGKQCQFLEPQGVAFFHDGPSLSRANCAVSFTFAVWTAACPFDFHRHGFACGQFFWQIHHRQQLVLPCLSSHAFGVCCALQSADIVVARPRGSGMLLPLGYGKVDRCSHIFPGDGTGRVLITGLPVHTDSVEVCPAWQQWLARHVPDSPGAFDGRRGQARGPQCPHALVLHVRAAAPGPHCEAGSPLFLNAPSCQFGRSTSCISALMPELDAFWRSLCLLQLLAFLRLILLAVPCKAGFECRNRSLHTGRASLKGAPLCLCLAFCVIGASAMPAPVSQSAAASFQDTEPPASLPPIASAGLVEGPRNMQFAVHLRQPDRDSPNYSISSDSDQQYSPRDELSVQEPESANTRFWSFPIQVLRLQSPALCMPMAINGFRDHLDLLRQAEKALEADLQHCSFLPVDPQPSADQLVLVAAPVASEHMFLTPVCIQLQAGDDMFRLWMELCDPDITYEGLRQTLGQDWPAGARIYVGHSSQQLPEFQSAKLTPGTLIRILEPRRLLRTVPTFAAKLQNYDRHLGDVAVQGYPREEYRPHRYGLLQPLKEPRTVDFLPIGGMEALDEVVLSHAHRGFGPARLHWPQAQPSRCLVRGRPVDKVAGAFPEACTLRVPLFVDGRAIGTPCQVYAAADLVGFAQFHRAGCALGRRAATVRHDSSVCGWFLRFGAEERAFGA